MSFLDPPYSLNLWQELAHLADSHIKNNGYIYVEADRDLSQLHLPQHGSKLNQPKLVQSMQGFTKSE